MKNVVLKFNEVKSIGEAPGATSRGGDCSAKPRCEVQTRQQTGRPHASYGSAVLFGILILVICLPGYAQLGGNQDSGPLYGPRPDLNQTTTGLPPVLKDVGIEQRLNEQLPLDTTFQDETGKTVRLGDYFNGKPVVLSLAYFNCAMLCTQVLNGLTGSMKGVSFNAGQDYNVITVSFDSREKPELAAAKKQLYIDSYQRPNAAEGWHFLTGDEASIQKLTQAVGFHFKFDPTTNQFAHASGIMVLTPQGKISHYFYGIEYAPKDLRLALVEASQNKIGSPVDQLLLYCYHYDPATGKYGAAVMNIIRLAGIATVLAMLALILLLRRRAPLPVRSNAGGTA